MKFTLFTIISIIFSVCTIQAQEVLLKGDNTSMVNLYGDVKLLSIELTKNPKTQLKTHAAKGFKVQVYYGTEKSEAEATRTSLNKKYAKQKPTLQFDSPTYWVKMGNFQEREEAETFLNSISKEFPKAVVVPDQIIIITK